MLGIQIKGPSREIYTKIFDPTFVISKYQEIEATAVSQTFYQDIEIEAKKIGELSLFIYAPAEYNELYLEHCMDCLANVIYDTLNSQITEENAIEQYLTLSTTICEILDDGFLLYNRTPKVFEEGKKESGLMSGLISGAKIVAKTLLS